MSRQPPTRAELLAALSVAIDLGLGQPAEHMLKSALIATRLADRLGLARPQRDAVYYTTLIMWIGCHADSHEFARWFGDDIAVRHDSYFVDWTGMPYQRFILGNIKRGESLLDRLKTISSLVVNARGQVSQLIHSHCMSAALLAERMGLDGDVRAALPFAFERWDGAGLPTGAGGDAIPLPMRIAQLADAMEVHHRTFGLDGAVATARKRRGGQFDPQIVDAFVGDPAPIVAHPPGGDVWGAAVREAPDRDQRTDDASLDALLAALGEFVDLKCPFLLGHSAATATLVAEAARVAGLPDDAVAEVRRAGHVHDLGRIGVSNRIWSKCGPLGAADRERMRLHPYFTVRILRQVQGLEKVAAIAGNHHERLDGSGYPRGLMSATLTPSDRLLAAAACYQSALEPRPYRDPLSPPAAERRLRDQVRAGGLDAAAVDAVLTAAGRPTGRPSRPGGLTAREAEVLTLVARGHSNAEIASSLVISVKTARNHVERIYTKIGVRNRIGASMFALQNGLVGPTGD